MIALVIALYVLGGALAFAVCVKDSENGIAPSAIAALVWPVTVLFALVCTPYVVWLRMREPKR